VRRGYRDATSNEQLGTEGMKDVPWLRWLREHFGNQPYVLVTYDNQMAVEHAAVLNECGTTLAVIDSRVRGPAAETLSEDEYTSEVIHRHAHRFIAQEPGSIFKYRCSERRARIKLDLTERPTSTAP
jgi:hypothetical protein